MCIKDLLQDYALNPSNELKSSSIKFEIHQLHGNTDLLSINYQFQAFFTEKLLIPLDFLINLGATK
jgi:hypothetical protein